MKTIHKFQLGVEAVTVVELPKGARILAVQLQTGKPVMWALVDTDAPKESRSFRTVCTGENLGDPYHVVMDYIGTYQMEEGSLVLHVFEYKMGFFIAGERSKTK